MAIDTARAFGAPEEARLKTILLATDLMHRTSRATDEAIELAARLKARLLVVNVLDVGRGLPLRGRGAIRPVEERHERALVARDVVQRARAAGADATFLVWDGEAAGGILAAADAESADMIVMGTRGRGPVERSLLGSVSDRVIRHARCPVLVVRPGDD